MTALRWLYDHAYPPCPRCRRRFRGWRTLAAHADDCGGRG